MSWNEDVGEQTLRDHKILSEQHMKADFSGLLGSLPDYQRDFIYIYIFIFNVLLCPTSVSKAQNVTSYSQGKKKRKKKISDFKIDVGILNNCVDQAK